MQNRNVSFDGTRIAHTLVALAGLSFPENFLSKSTQASEIPPKVVALCEKTEHSVDINNREIRDQLVSHIRTALNRGLPEDRDANGKVTIAPRMVRALPLIQEYIELIESADDITREEFNSSISMAVSELNVLRFSSVELPRDTVISFLNDGALEFEHALIKKLKEHAKANPEEAVHCEREIERLRNDVLWSEFHNCSDAQGSYSQTIWNKAAEIFKEEFLSSEDALEIDKLNVNLYYMGRINAVSMPALLDSRDKIAIKIEQFAAELEKSNHLSKTCELVALLHFKSLVHASSAVNFNHGKATTEQLVALREWHNTKIEPAFQTLAPHVVCAVMLRNQKYFVDGTDESKLDIPPPEVTLLNQSLSSIIKRPELLLKSLNQLELLSQERSNSAGVKLNIYRMVPCFISKSHKNDVLTNWLVKRFNKENDMTVITDEMAPLFAKIYYEDLKQAPKVTAEEYVKNTNEIFQLAFLPSSPAEYPKHLTVSQKFYMDVTKNAINGFNFRSLYPELKITESNRYTAIADARQRSVLLSVALLDNVNHLLQERNPDTEYRIPKILLKVVHIKGEISDLPQPVTPPHYLVEARRLQMLTNSLLVNRIKELKGTGLNRDHLAGYVAHFMKSDTEKLETANEAEAVRQQFFGDYKKYLSFSNSSGVNGIFNKQYQNLRYDAYFQKYQLSVDRLKSEAFDKKLDDSIYNVVSKGREAFTYQLLLEFAERKEGRSILESHESMSDSRVLIDTLNIVNSLGLIDAEINEKLAALDKDRFISELKDLLKVTLAEEIRYKEKLNTYLKKQ